MTKRHNLAKNMMVACCLSFIAIPSMADSIPYQKATQSKLCGAGSLAEAKAQCKENGFTNTVCQSVGANYSCVPAPKEASTHHVRPQARDIATPNTTTHTASDNGVSTCSGVEACNEMIATCIALGGNVSPGGSDSGTGAPNQATCYSPGD